MYPSKSKALRKIKGYSSVVVDTTGTDTHDMDLDPQQTCVSVLSDQLHFCAHDDIVWKVHLECQPWCGKMKLDGLPWLPHIDIHKASSPGAPLIMPAILPTQPYLYYLWNMQQLSMKNATITEICNNWTIRLKDWGACVSCVRHTSVIFRSMLNFLPRCNKSSS